MGETRSFQPDLKNGGRLDFQGTFNITSYTQHTYIMYTNDLYCEIRSKNSLFAGG